MGLWYLTHSVKQPICCEAFVSHFFAKHVLEILPVFFCWIYINLQIAPYSSGNPKISIISVLCKKIILSYLLSVVHSLKSIFKVYVLMYMYFDIYIIYAIDVFLL